MKNEVLVWIFVIAIIISVALYIRFFYQPTLTIALSSNNTVQSLLYPYQKVMLSFGVLNRGGSAINNMSVGILVNGNVTSLYKVTLPAGKQATIYYNYSPTKAGSYNISAVADPGKLYNLEDRAGAQAGIEFTVQQPQDSAPEGMLPKSNITAISGENFTRAGYLLSSYLSNQYDMSGLALTNDGSLNNFITPVLNLTSYYIKNISVSDADYDGGSSIYSIWIKGYLSANIFSIAAAASNLKWNSTTTTAGTTTFVNVSKNTTFCSWYAGGWLKTLSVRGAGTCLGLLLPTGTPSGNLSGGGISNTLYERIMIKNSSVIGNYSGMSGNKTYAAKTFFFTNTSFIYASISNNSIKSGTCYGIISKFNGTDYCSTYLLPTSGGIQSLSLIRTTAYVGTYNYTLLSLMNTSIVLRQVPIMGEIIDSIKTQGPSLAMTSGVVNTCSLNETFGCSNLAYNNGTVTYELTNRLNTTLNVKGAECYTVGSTIAFPINVTLGSFQSTNVSTACYGLTGKLSGFVIGQHLKLAINYTIANATKLALGTAFIPFG
jgi:hypothetical protein